MNVKRITVDFGADRHCVNRRGEGPGPPIRVVPEPRVDDGRVGVLPADDPGGAPRFAEYRVEERLARDRAVVDWCLRNAGAALDAGALEQTLRWDVLAARVLGSHCRPLALPDLERQLLAVAARLPAVAARSEMATVRRWLHVFNDALPYGGHTAMAIRWMELEPSYDRHSAILLDQKRPVPETLRRAVQRTGGQIFRFDPFAPLVARALDLRTRAWSEADVIVLHIYPWDVLTTAAFGVPGGPPVLLVNHGAHKFWLGRNVADLVVNCRGSDDEYEWNDRLRGIEAPRSVTLPIPLPRPHMYDGTVTVPANIRAAARAMLRLPDQACIMLTVGTAAKYTPLRDLSFFEVARAILLARPNSILLAVGPPADANWKALAQVTGGRAVAMGHQSDVAAYHEAADLYLEGFPFGSTTALLESAVRGLPCVLAPVPPPFGSAGVALAGLSRPVDVADYVETVIALIDDPERRVTIGRALATAVASHHTEPGWTEYLHRIQNRILDAEHRVYACQAPEDPARDLVSFWTAFMTRVNTSDVVVGTFGQALRLGLSPWADRPFRKAVGDARRSGLVGSVAVLSFLAVLGVLSNGIPRRYRVVAFDRLCFVFRREGRLWRTARLIRDKLSGVLGLRARTSARAGGREGR